MMHGQENIKLSINLCYTVCPTRYRTRHFFNNSNINENIATKFEQEYVRCVRNEKECVCSAPNCCDTEQRSASQPGSVASGTHGIRKKAAIFSMIKIKHTNIVWPQCIIFIRVFERNCEKLLLASSCV